MIRRNLWTAVLALAVLAAAAPAAEPPLAVWRGTHRRDNPLHQSLIISSIIFH